ncbi:MAG: aldehyde dehydrogenase family protein [Flavisolibacter sp.]|nr:aldehyde dehydrogenase family protein [Flavisolibacter sp.]
MEAYKDLNLQFINGVWKQGSESDSIDDYNPYDNSVVATFKAAGLKDVNEAYKAARKAQEAWGQTLPQTRSDIMTKAANIIEQRKDEIADLMTKECGSTVVKRAIELQIGINIIREAASFPTRQHGYVFDSFTPGKESRVYRKPLGVVGVISPFNFPFNLSLRSVATALAVGNAVVLKPTSETPIIGGTIIGKIFEEAGLPKGVLNVVVGKSSVIGDAFVEHPIPKLISFTGSTPVGTNLAKLAAGQLKKTSLELGGNNVFIVMDDADIDQAVEAAMFGKFLHQGQICMSINRILLQEKIFDSFKEKFVARVKKLKFGNPSDKDVLIGPLIDDKAVQRILKSIDASVARGAKIETGGKANGQVLEPTVMSNVKNDYPIAHEEIFGPVAPLISFKTTEEVLAMANELNYGLSGALHTSDVAKGVELARQITTGMIHINDQSVNDEPNAPFGGEKGSGLGRFNGEFIIEELTTLQWVTVQHKKRDYSPF